MDKCIENIKQNVKYETFAVTVVHKTKMAAPMKKTVELFYDVVSPYTWIGFEVCINYLECKCQNLIQCHGFNF